jgi:hypothetical protein
MNSKIFIKMNSKIGQRVTVKVPTTYGHVEVDFLIIDIADSSFNIFLAYAQKRLAKIRSIKHNEWEFIEDIDLKFFV